MRKWSSLAFGFLAFAADRAHKYAQIEWLAWPEGHFVPALPFVDLGFVYNRGVSFGLLGGLPGPALALVIGGALAALGLWWIRAKTDLARLGLAVALGGALSNLADRWLYGAVADFFWLHIGDLSLFVFNLADAAITLGVGLLLLDSLRARRL